MGKEVNKLNPNGQRQRYEKAFKFNAVDLLKQIKNLNQWGQTRFKSMGSDSIDF